MEDGSALAPWIVSDDVTNRLVNTFDQFFDAQLEDIGDYYRNQVDEAITNLKRRIIIRFDDLAKFDRSENSNITQDVIKNPRIYQKAINTSLNKFRRTVNLVNDIDLTFGFTGNMGDNFLNPRTLSSRFLSQIICLDGIVTKTSLVNPKLLELTNFCEATKRISRQTFIDNTDLTQIPRRFAIQTKDSNENPLDVEFGLSTFVDHQIITVQERPEAAPAGQMPRSCDVILDGDLSDSCKPGDRVKIYGVYRILPNRVQGIATGIYRPILIANNVEVSAQVMQISLTQEDISNIEKISKEDGIVDILSRSIAPSIYGHDFIKKALVLQLAGGCEKNLSNGTHIRGDINVLMVGDPSTAKSQLLRHILHIAPLAVHTTGRGSSGVGLTASVSSDPETGERKLEAGAMVIADRGVVCIDEFDKMDMGDRVAIHEALEQQTVTISKAGIHTTLNARCSVAAAANPVWGTYNANRSPMDNIGLPDSLISRFDLLFVVLDQHDQNTDRMIARHVLKSHRWRGSVSESGDGIFVQQNALIYTDDSDQLCLTVEFIKKYITHCKQLKPILTDEAKDILVSEWSQLRTIHNRRTQPITIRAFETLIRLATAHAKIRLDSKEVKREDALIAIELLRFSIFGNTLKPKDKPRKRKPPVKSERIHTESATDFDTDVSQDSLPDTSTDGYKTDDDYSDDNSPLAQQRKAVSNTYLSIIQNTDRDYMDLEEFRNYVKELEGVELTKEELKKILRTIENVVFDDEIISFI